MVGFTRVPCAWLGLQEYSVHDWVYKSTQCMIGFTRVLSTWLGLQEYYVHGWVYKSTQYMAGFTSKSTQYMVGFTNKSTRLKNTGNAKMYINRQIINFSSKLLRKYKQKK